MQSHLGGYPGSFATPAYFGLIAKSLRYAHTCNRYAATGTQPDTAADGCAANLGRLPA